GTAILYYVDERATVASSWHARGGLTGNRRLHAGHELNQRKPNRRRRRTGESRRVENARKGLDLRLRIGFAAKRAAVAERRHVADHTFCVRRQLLIGSQLRVDIARCDHNIAACDQAVEQLDIDGGPGIEQYAQLTRHQLGAVLRLADLTVHALGVDTSRSPL